MTPAVYRPEPTLAISHDARTVVIGRERDLTVVDLAAPSEPMWRSLASPAGSAVVDVDVGIIVSAADDELAVLTDGREPTTTSVHGRVMFARVLADGDVIALTRSDDTGTHLHVFDRRDLHPRLAPAPIGTWSAHIVQLDRGNAAIIGGLAGTRAWDGDGKPFLRRVSWAGGEPAVDWRGDGLPDDLDHLAVAGGRLVAARSSTLFISSIDALVRDGEADGPAADAAADVEMLAISPDGGQICWVTRRTGVARLWSRMFGSDDTVDRGDLGDLSEVGAVLAIGDGGDVTVAGVVAAGTIDVAVAPAAQPLSPQLSISVDRLPTGGR